MPTSIQHVILIGASTRAAATSARRAGWSPWCADLFADADLRRIATARKVAADAYPTTLLDAIADAPDAPVIYTGALENRPSLIARLQRPLWGNTAEVLRAMRSPQRWSRCLHAGGLPCPQLRHEPAPTGRWLLKPIKSAGGFGIHTYAGQPFDPRTHFLQEHIEGLPCSAIFLGHDDNATLLGVTQQLIGTCWLHASGFHYAGSVGPLPIAPATAVHWRAIGIALCRSFHLRGLFGVDAVMRNGVPWPVEINPRYTASVEILERSGKTALLTLHHKVFAPTAMPNLATPPAHPTIWAKGFLFAKQTLRFPSDGAWMDALQDGVNLDQTEYADIPHAGDIIEQGRPVLTLFASAETVEECMAKLQEKAQALARCLWG